MITIIICLAVLMALMAVAITDPCALADQVASAGCINCLTQTEKLAARVHAKALALAALDGLDISSVTALRAAVACRCVPNSTLESFEVLAAQRMASSAGAQNIPTTAAEIRQAIKCYCGVSQHELLAAESILDCYLAAEVGGGQIL